MTRSHELRTFSREILKLDIQQRVPPEGVGLQERFPIVQWRRFDEMKIGARIIAPVVLILLLLHLSCEDKGTEPIVVKNPRNYSWSVDTFYFPYIQQTMLTTVWGSSSQNVYVTGSTSGGGAPLAYRFDGSKWNSVILPGPQGLGVKFEISQIFGLSASDIYAVGVEYFFNPAPPPLYLDSSLVLHFDAASWKQISLPQRGGNLTRIWGVSASNIYVAGGKALWHFDGSVWTKDTIPRMTSAGSWSGISGLSGSGGGQLFLTYVYRPEEAEPTELYYFVHWTMGSWSFLDSAIVEPTNVQLRWGYADLWTNPSGIMYSSSYGIHVWQDQAWSKVYDSQVPLNRIWGTDNNNIFAVGNLGTVLNYNGIDWFQFDQFQNQNVLYTGVWTDGKEVFVAGHTVGGAKSIILHGR